MQILYTTNLQFNLWNTDYEEKRFVRTTLQRITKRQRTKLITKKY
jgi:hypothetical protein